MVRSGGPSSPPNGGCGGERCCDDRRAASVFILRRIGGRSPYAARRRDPPTGGERYSRRPVRRGAYCSVEQVVRYTGPTGGKDESTAWEGQEKAQLRSYRTFPTRSCPHDETEGDSASRKMCVCVCVCVCVVVVVVEFHALHYGAFVFLFHLSAM